MDFNEIHKKTKGAKSEMCNNHLGIMLTGFILRTQYFYLGGARGAGWGRIVQSVLNTLYVRHS